MIAFENVPQLRQLSQLFASSQRDLNPSPLRIARNLIVMNHGSPVRRQPNVKLKAIAAISQSLIERLYRILRNRLRRPGTAMSKPKRSPVHGRKNQLIEVEIADGLACIRRLFDPLERLLKFLFQHVGGMLLRLHRLPKD